MSVRTLGRVGGIRLANAFSIEHAALRLQSCSRSLTFTRDELERSLLRMAIKAPTAKIFAGRLLYRWKGAGLITLRPPFRWALGTTDVVSAYLNELTEAIRDVEVPEPVEPVAPAPSTSTPGAILVTVSETGGSSEPRPFNLVFKSLHGLSARIRSRADVGVTVVVHNISDIGQHGDDFSTALSYARRELRREEVKP